MFAPLTVILAMVGYMGVLFALAQMAERTRLGRRWASSPLVYALGLGVYCTTWTFYGSVGKAAGGGMGYLPVYLGPTLALLLGGSVFRRIAQLKHAHRITSLADFISARYAKSQAVAALVTVILTLGIIPYIALQIKAATSTFGMLTAAGGGGAAASTTWFAPIAVALMIVFTIVFGIRHLDPTERHPGMVVSLAAESIVKLVAFVAAGAFVVGAAFGGVAGFDRALDQLSPTAIPLFGRASANDTLNYVAVMLLSTAAFAFLPRQFHVGVVENNRPDDVKTSQWLTPVYLLLINLFVVPLALGGKRLAAPGTSADYFVLALPLQAGRSGLSLAVFLGGFSAAIGMIMIESMTMATMISNHLLLPVVQLVKGLHGLRRHVLFMRWAAAAAFILGGYLFAVKIGSAYPLVAIGLISFAAAFVLAPVILGGLYWHGANRAGALLGLGAGFAVWFYTLMLPTFVKAGWVSQALLGEGPGGVGWLRPEALFGFGGLPPLAHGVLWSALSTVLAFVGGSLVWRPSRDEVLMAEAFLGDAHEQLLHLEGAQATIDLGERLARTRPLLWPYFTAAEAEQLLQRAVAEVGCGGREKITVVACAELTLAVERMLAGALGAAAAHGVMKQLGGFERKDKKSLEREFARALASLKVSPKDLKARIDYQRDRESLLEEQFRALQSAHDELELRVIERTQELRAILDNVVFGFLVVGRDLVVRPGFTRSCRTLLETEEIGGRHLCELLGVEAAEREIYAISAEQIFDDVLAEELTVAQLRQRFQLGSGRILRIEPRPVRDDQDRIVALLMTISDISQLEQAQRENENNRALLAILRQRPSFEAFLHETKEQLRAARAAVGEDPALVRRLAHTIKGNAGLYGLSHVGRLIHELEDLPALGEAELEAIARSFRDFLGAHARVLGVSFDGPAGRSFILGEEQLQRLRALEPALEPSARGRLAALLAEVAAVPVADLLGPLPELVDSLAARFDKDVALEIRGGDVRVDARQLAPLFHVIPHLVRNAIDHGIEPRAERGAKPARACVVLEVRAAGDGYEIALSDDGRGIDLDAVVAAARAAGVLSDEQARGLTDEQKVALIFRDQISTAAQVSDVSGRGLGMSAVLAEVQRLGGRLQVRTSRGSGTRIEIVVPADPAVPCLVAAGLSDRGQPSRLPS